MIFFTNALKFSTIWFWRENIKTSESMVAWRERWRRSIHWPRPLLLSIQVYNLYRQVGALTNLQPPTTTTPPPPPLRHPFLITTQPEQLWRHRLCVKISFGFLFLEVVVDGVGVAVAVALQSIDLISRLSKIKTPHY